MGKFRIGIIGLGGMGKEHARYLMRNEVPAAELTAIADVSPHAIQWARENCGEKVKTFENPDAFFAANLCDGVIIATPHYFHPPLSIQAFNHGLHVLCEKPAGVYTRQVREMNEAAAKSGKVFSMMFMMRTMACHQKLKNLIASGEVGEIKRTNYVMTDWLRPQSYYDSGGWRATWGGEGGGVLLNQCPHNLDLWQWICGLPVRVRAFLRFGRYHKIEVEDDVTAYVEYANGASGVCVATTGEAPGSNRLEIVGDRGRVLLEGEKITFWRTTVPVSQHLRESKDFFGVPESWKIEVPGGGGEMHKGITKNWIDAIQKGTPLLVRGEDGIRSLQLSNAMHLSAWTDDWVSIPVDEELYCQKLQDRIEAAKHK